MRLANRIAVGIHVRRIWRAFFIIIALIVMITTTALAAGLPVTGTYTGRIIGREITFDRNGKQVKDWAGLLNLRLDSGENIPVYCVEVDVLVRSGDRYRSDGPVLALPNGCKIRYLLDTYPASSAKSADEAAARQMAIWALSDGVDLTTITGTIQVRDRAIALVKEAKSAPCPAPRTTIPGLTLEPPTTSAAIGQAVAYTVRAGPEGAGQSVTVAVSGPAVLANGQQQLSMALDGQGNGTFEVTSTGAGSTTVKITLPYQLDAGTVFSHLNDSKKTQRLVMATKQQLIASATSQINWVPPTERPTERPKPPEHPTETAVPTPEITPAVGGAQPSPTPEIASPQPSPTPEVAAAQSAGGAGPQQPRRLPRTSEPAGTPLWPVLGLALAISACGWLLRRKAHR